MELAINALVTLLQIGLVAFLIWGAALCLRELLGRPRGARQARDMKQVAVAEQADFERVASLVLLALLFTPIAGLA